MTDNLEITVLDGALAVRAAPIDALHVSVGCATAGPIATPIETASIKELVDTFTSGPMPEAAALVIYLTGASVIAMRTTTQTAGAASAVVFTGTGTSVITVTGNPVDKYDAVVSVITGGTIGVAGIQFKYSLDGGRKWSPTIDLGTANTYAIPGSGATLNFAAGTLVAGDAATFTTTEPLFDATGATACITAFQNAANVAAFFHFVSKVSGSDATTIANALDSMASGRFKYAFFFGTARDNNAGESGATWKASIITDFSGVSNRRAIIGAGMRRITSPITKWTHRRPVAWAAVVRKVAVPLSEDLGWVNRGSLNAIVEPAVPADITDAGYYHDEAVSPGLDAARFLTVMTRPGRPGVFVKNAKTMAAPGSDFDLEQFTHIIDAACRTLREALEGDIGSRVRLDPTTGKIIEKDALALETKGRNALDRDLTNEGHASSCVVVVSRTDNIASTKQCNVEARIQPPGYLKTIVLRLGFFNPGNGA